MNAVVFAARFAISVQSAIFDTALSSDSAGHQFADGMWIEFRVKATALPLPSDSGLAREDC
jgi:hypothetical protein